MEFVALGIALVTSGLLNIYLSRRVAELTKAHFAYVGVQADRYQALLDRVATEPRFELSPERSLPAPTEDVKYISDFPYHDEAWNDFRGEPEPDEDEQ